MADARITDLTALSSAADGDVLYIVDISDTTDNVAGSSKKITIANLRNGLASRIRIAGSSFSGVDGSQGRAYTHTVGFSGDEQVCIGISGGRMTTIDPVGGYSLSTVSITNDTITIVGELFDDEAVIVWQ